MTALFERKCSLLVGKPPTNYVELLPGALEITDLRMQFRVEKTLSKEPNTCEVTVTNLSEKSRAQIQGKGLKVILQAGYPGTIAQIFAGDARFAESTRSGADWLTKIQCGDGERAYQFARVNESFSSGAKVLDVLKSVAKSMFLDPGNLEEKANTLTAQFVNGYSMHGKASREVDKLLAQTDYTWSIQDGRFQLLKFGEATKESVVQLDADNPPIGSLAHGTPDKKGGPAVLKGKCLLQPSIKPGRRLSIKLGGTNDGVYKVIKVIHSGDTSGGDWYTEFEAHTI